MVKVSVPPQTTNDRSRHYPRQVPRLTSCGSQAGDQYPKNRGIFLFGLTQLKISYGWGSMAHIWNSADLRKPPSTAQPSIHSFNAVQ